MNFAAAGSTMDTATQQLPAGTAPGLAVRNAQRARGGVRPDPYPHSLVDGEVGAKALQVCRYQRPPVHEGSSTPNWYVARVLHAPVGSKESVHQRLGQVLLPVPHGATNPYPRVAAAGLVTFSPSSRP